MGVRVGARVGNNCGVFVGPVGGLVIVGLCALVLGGLVGWVLPAVVLGLKLALLAFVVGVVWLVVWAYRHVREENRLQAKWEALSLEERQRFKDEDYRRRLHTTTEQLRARRLAQRPSGFR